MAIDLDRQTNLDDEQGLKRNTLQRREGDRREQIAGCGMGSRHRLSLGHAHNDGVTDQYLLWHSPGVEPSSWHAALAKHVLP